MAAAPPEFVHPLPVAVLRRPVAARIDGLLLAGGRSRRYGRDKRREAVGGRTMAERALARLRDCVDGDVFVAGRGAFDRPVRAVLVDDAAPRGGPLAGIVGALLRSRFGVLVLPCDTPLLGSDTLRAVAARARRGDGTVVVRSRRGLEPLVAFYPREALPFLVAALRDGRRALHRLLPHLDPVEVAAGSSREMLNVNVPSDLALALPAGASRTRGAGPERQA